MTNAEKSRRIRLKQRYREEVNRATRYYNYLNKQQPTIRYYLTKEEIENMTEVKESCHKLKIGGNK